MARIRLKRGTRAQLNAAASAGALVEGEPYFITDENRFAIGTGQSAYESFAKEADVGKERVWTPGMIVSEWEKVNSPADKETYQRITAAGGGSVDPADDMTNYVARSYERFAAFATAASVAIMPYTGASTDAGRWMNGVAKSSLPAFISGIRTLVLSITGRGSLGVLAYLLNTSVAPHTMRFEIEIDGRIVRDTIASFDYSINAVSLLFAGGGVSGAAGSGEVANPHYSSISGDIKFRRTLRVYMTASASVPSGTKLANAYVSEA